MRGQWKWRNGSILCLNSKEKEESELMKMHPEKGAVIVSQILQNVDDAVFREIAVNIAYYHHEKWNAV